MNQMSSLSTRRSNKNLSAKQLFDKYEDGSGKISFSEFQNMLPDMGIQLSIPKQIEYFRLCDKDENGQIDFEEFKVALYVSDTEEVNHIGFNPGTILRPRDAFDMFDKDGSGKIDEEEFHFLLKYLNIEIDEVTHEKMFRKYDKDKSGYIEFQEFKKAWLLLTNTRKELQVRGIEIPTLATKFQMMKILEKALEEEEEQERLALKETERWRINQERLKVKRKYIIKAKTQAKAELCNALDAGGSVYVFGSGSLNQFSRASRSNMNAPFLQEGQDLIQLLWSSRVGSSKDHMDQNLPRTTTVADDIKLDMNADSVSSKDFVLLDRALNVQQNTVWLWGRQCEGIAISESVIIAFNKGDSLYSWGGNDQWWHQTDADICWQNHSRGDMTARSNDLLGCRSNWKAEDSRQSGERYTHGETINELASKIKMVLQYYNAWSIPDGNIDLLDHAKQCLRNKVDRQRIAQSLKLRAKNTETLTKADMVEILYKDILLERKLLGEAIHLELANLDHEMIKFKQQRKIKLAKRRQYRFVEIWRPVRQAQMLDDIYIEKEKNEESLDQKADIGIDNTAGRCDNILEKGPSYIRRREDFAFNGLTPRDHLLIGSSYSPRWTMIDAGAHHAGLVDDIGRLWMWGLDSIGRLGQAKKKETQQEKSTSLHRFLPSPINIKPVQQFSCGYSHTAAVSKSGEVLVWGSGSCGKLGLGDVTSTEECFSSVPVPLKCFSSNPMVKVSCGSSHTAAVDRDGGLWIWGSGGGGRLGLGHRTDVFSPQLVKTVDEPIADVSCGNSQTLAISVINHKTGFCNKTKVRSISGGNLYVAGSAEVIGSTHHVFGSYEYFSCGQGSHQRISPVPIKQISAGFSHQSAVSYDGELFLWGDNTQGCCGQDLKVPFITHPTKVALYNKPKDLAEGKSMNRSVSYGNQPFFEVDLGDVASIREIKLRNCLTIPNNPAIDKSTYTGRLFPCWIMVSYENFPDSIGEGRLDAALQYSVVNKRFEENIHESVWKPPRGTKGRYVRVQMEGLNNMEFEKLQVFGSFEADTLEKVVSSTCGKRVTAAILDSNSNMDDLEMAYKRAVDADPYNAKILNQYDIYKGFNEKFQTVRKGGPFSVGCLLCIGETLCPLCQLKNDFKYILEREEVGRIEGNLFLEDIIQALINDKEEINL